MRAEPPFVSVIVPVYNNPAMITRCLEALEGQTYPADRYEVVVVDNASDEPVAPLAERHAHAVSAFEAHIGSYAARNAGIDRARGEILAFTDSDCLPEPDWLAAGVAALEAHQRAAIVAGAVENVACDSERQTLAELYETRLQFGQQACVARGFGTTASLFVHREVMQRAGRFDATLRSCGDTEWCWRARACGARIVYAGEARVRHAARRTLWQLARRVRRVAGGSYQLARRRGRWWQLRAALLWLRPPFLHSRLLLVDRSLGPLSMRLKIIGVLSFHRAVLAAETWRLTLGLGTPLR